MLWGMLYLSGFGVGEGCHRDLRVMFRAVPRAMMRQRILLPWCFPFIYFFFLEEIQR